MKYCNKCIMPNTRPYIKFDEKGVCSACNAHNIKKNIDWPSREKEFRKVVEYAKSHSNGYDCVIPVSGGKDSTWLTLKCLEYGLNPLAITWKNPARTPVGEKNLANLVRLGVDHIQYQINPKVEKKFLYQSLVKNGATAIPMHMAVFTIPFKIAFKFDVPLIIFVENTAVEYEGKGYEKPGVKLDRDWFKKYGVTNGTTAEDWVSENLTKKELTPYFLPSQEELESKGVQAVFLGQYFQWNPETSLKAALEHGFEARKEGPKTGYYNYADIDDEFLSIHHWLKWYKFGCTRMFDNLSIEIRSNRLTREEAIEILKKNGEQKPNEDISKLCNFIGITEEQFFEVAEKFRNKDIWTKKYDKWMIEDFLIPDWNWT